MIFSQAPPLTISPRFEMGKSPSRIVTFFIWLITGIIAIVALSVLTFAVTILIGSFNGESMVTIEKPIERVSVTVESHESDDGENAETSKPDVLAAEVPATEPNAESEDATMRVRVISGENAGEIRHLKPAHDR